MSVRRIALVASLVTLAMGAAPTRDLAQKVRPAVVLIKGTTADGGAVAGSGFIVDSSGTIVTNLHVISELVSAGVKTAAGDIFDAVHVRSFDRRRDIAVIQVPGFKLPTLELGDSDDVAQGDDVALELVLGGHDG